MCVPTTVVECYSGWAGPCKAVASSLKTLFFSYSDRPIKFYTVSAQAVSTAFLSLASWATMLAAI